MNKGKRANEIKMISIDRINILNPRSRNQKVFFDIATNITLVGLKRPVTVTPCRSGKDGKDYDLICGQGRIEAFMACGQTHIPAIVIETSEEQALIMSLVENLARRQPRATDLFQGIELLRKQGYDASAISTKTGLALDYIKGILHLMDHGEERLLVAVEAGHVPISLASRIAETPEDEQRVLHEAYESKQLRGNRLLLAKRLLETRRSWGKTYRNIHGRRGPSKRGVKPISTQDVLKIYQRETDRKRLISRKSDVVINRLMVVKEALRELLQDENFSTLLRAEGLMTLPKPLVGLMDEKAVVHG